MRWREDPAKVRPMLATLAEPPLTGAGLVFEPKYDGIRALVHVEPRRGGVEVRIWSRLGNDKTSQFPSIASALQKWGAGLEGPVLLDGEIVAVDPEGRPAGFQKLQGRIHLSHAKEVAAIEKQQPVALILFDILRDGDEDVRGLPLTERRARLEALLPRPDAVLRISEQVEGDGRSLHARALKEGWEGLIVKEARAPYQSGRRSPAWRKLKVVQQQEFVIGGWTEPRQTRQYFGALLLGVPVDGDPSRLEYVGHTGTGFDQKELARVWKLLKARETTESPFTTRFKTNEPAHWVKPELVAQVRFTEWTADRKLRHPVYLGLRDDKRPADVVVEIPNQADAPTTSLRAAHRTPRTADRAPRTSHPGPRTAHRAPRTQHRGPRTADRAPRTPDPGPRMI
ncbi:MAG TPA: non-homologous end-joining DNA ligase [Vicinamibacterales bacterium]